MEYCNIIVTEYSEITENFLVVGTDKATLAEAAEDLFLELCSNRIWNFDEYGQAHKEAILDNGVETYGNNSIIISWPQIKHIQDTKEI